MPRADRQPTSLRRVLTGWLIWPLAALILASAVPNYYLALGAANNAYDNALLDPALAIAHHISTDGLDVSVNLPRIAIDALRVDARDQIYLQVRGPNGEFVAGNPNLPNPPIEIPPSGHAFYDLSVDGDKMRVVALRITHPIGSVFVQAAETYYKRDRIVLEILVASMLSELIVAVAAIALLWYGISRGLEPLDELRDEIAARSLKDLSPVIATNKPSEVLPIIAALNQLLGRLKGSLDGQQRFIANAAHQLRTPLAGLKTHAELALRQPGTAELRSLIEMISGETERTSRLVNQLLTLARAEPEGMANPDYNPINLREIVGHAVQEWVPRAVTKNIDIGFELQDAWTLGEPLLMRELLANLLDNALSYSPAGSSVTVRTAEQAGKAVLEVEDNGPGIAEMERERVFERFYRAKGTRGNGCGLGLSIVAEIVDRHRGAVSINTPAGGMGTLLRAEFEGLAHAASADAQAVDAGG